MGQHASDMTAAQAASPRRERCLVVGSFGDAQAEICRHILASGLELRTSRTITEGRGTVATFDPDVILLHWSSVEMRPERAIAALATSAVGDAAPQIIATDAPMPMPPPARLAALHHGASLVMGEGPLLAEFDAALTALRRTREERAGIRHRLDISTRALDRLQAQFDLIDNDLIQARKLQKALLRDRLLTVEDVTLSLLLRSAGHVGGDLVGHFPIDGRRVGFYALDVSGHGISSALMTARLAGYVTSNLPHRNIALTRDAEGRVVPRPPADTLEDFNAQVMADVETEHYFTMLLGHIDVMEGELVFAQAGHPHPILLRADGTARPLGQGGLPMGLIPGATYDEHRVRLAPGDRFVVVSDGMTEAMDTKGQQLGDTGLAKILSGMTKTAPQRFLEVVLWHLSQHVGDAGFDDDISGLIVARD
ncbi:MAG: PP2C family protein-serine/threonine phosphatase [Shimia sp.]